MAIATKVETFLGTGRRKCAIARVRLTSGTGKITINDRELEEYFMTELLAQTATAPLSVVEMRESVDIVVRTHGGGYNGQSDAVALGIARALEKMNPDLRIDLKKAGHITRDGRVKERKKPGQPGARRKFQFSKR